MSFEIDFLAVGQEGKCGDAILLRHGDFLIDPRRQTVVAVDGGYADNGAQIIEHVRREYHTNRINVVISTHPDLDHVSGLVTVLEDRSIEVDAVVMHQPWNHAANIKAMIQDGRVTAKGISDRLRASLDKAVQVERLALAREIEPVEPFAGRPITDSLFVAGPSLEFYRSLLPTFVGAAAPPVVPEALRLAQQLLAPQVLRRKVVELWNRETLVEPAPEAVTSRNNSSTVLYFRDSGDDFLFTSDVGTLGLDGALAQLRAWGLDPSLIHYVQLPHHGSKRNIGPRLMSTFFGPVGTPTRVPQTAIVSAPLNGEPKHPSRRVTNAAIRRGANVYVTRGRGINFRSADVPLRDGWELVALESFMPEYEDEE